MKTPEDIIRLQLAKLSGGCSEAVDECADVIIGELEAKGYKIVSKDNVKPACECGEPCLHDQSENETVQPNSQTIVAYWDGNGNNSNGKSGRAEWRLYMPDGRMFPGIKEFAFSKANTSNFLEYQGLIECLAALLDDHIGCANLRDTNVIVRGDSNLVVAQVNGKWRTKELALIPLRNRAQALLAECRALYKSVKLEWCSSEKNLCDPHS